jgi:isoleucyl-tRNA synthetase
MVVKFRLALPIFARFLYSTYYMFLDEGFNVQKIEEKVLAFWDEHKTFEKSLQKTAQGEPFTFYDGPPFATGIPHYGHILASTVKDLVGRYQTMRGRYVRRRWGWDCHGLPIEEIVERKLGISGKKQIEEIGIGKFNETCRTTVLQFVDEWRKMIRRIARWVDFDNSYKTMDRDYMESVWWAFKQIYDKGLVYEGRKVLLYCPRCETPISNFEVAMDNSYKDVTEEAVTVKFLISNDEFLKKLRTPDDRPTYLLAWTTTPWTLPGNVALAVGKDIEYSILESNTTIERGTSGGNLHLTPGNYIVASARVPELIKEGNYFINERKLKGSDLVGLGYKPLFDVPAVAGEKSYKVYAGDFVNTEEGTGIVHTAVVYGEDDYQLGLREGLPVVPLLDEKGMFNDKSPELIRGQYFKDTEKLIKKDLADHDLLFDRTMHQHSYPHCWRCGTTLFYNAIPAWFINVQKIKKDLLASNDKEINWFPDHLKHGRYEKSVEAAPDWNISRNRYWGNPIPIWKCEDCKKDTVVGSIKELGLGTNTFYFSRHGEADSNVGGFISSYPEPRVVNLTTQGEEQVQKMAEQIKAWGGVDMIYASDLLRTKQTAEIAGKVLGAPVHFDPRLREYSVGVWNGKLAEEFDKNFLYSERWSTAPEGGETHRDLQERMADFVAEMNRKQSGKRILVVSHGDALLMLQRYFGSEREYPQFADPFTIDTSIVNLHRPHIDEVVLACKACGGRAKRIPEIFDSWVEAGSMPFAEYHYPFEQKEVFENRLPGQFVAEYIAQTRAWFYVMHVLSFALFGKAPFENVVTTGTILAEDGAKMSKSKNNFPDPYEVLNKYGVDSLRFYLMSSPVMQADNLNFSERDLEKTYRKNVLILWNVFNYYRTYAGESLIADRKSQATENTLDAWIKVRTKELVNSVTEHLDAYDTVRATRAMEHYIDDLSTWYLRRSRGRTDQAFFETLREALLATSKVIAPVMPYLSEVMYQNLGADLRGQERRQTQTDTEAHTGATQPLAISDKPSASVHLADWPKAEALTNEERELLEDMQTIRDMANVGQGLRKSLNIPVRQPLAKLVVRDEKLEMKGNPQLIEILKDELNVRDVVVNAKLKVEAELDVVLTDELKHEGLIRELERFVQEMRKTNGLKVGEMVSIAYATSDEEAEEALLAINRTKTYVSEIAKGNGGDFQATFTHGDASLVVGITRK